MSYCLQPKSVLGKHQKLKQSKKLILSLKKFTSFQKSLFQTPQSLQKKINNKLREYVLGATPNTKDANIFDSVWRTNDRVGNISDLSFKISEANASLISMTISGEGCGAYCESFDYHFTFNAKTGNQLSLDSLFTKEGIKTFVKTLNDNKMQKLNNKLKEINQSLHESC